MSRHGRDAKLQARRRRRARSGRQLLLSRAFASQAACYVIAVGGMRSHADTPERYRALSTIEYTGDSCIIDPRGEIIAGPGEGETILIAEGSREAVLAAKSLSDIGGHYSRPDLLRLVVDRRPVQRMMEAKTEAEFRVALKNA
ncbi:MAG TPA: nitrilase-related carbon-nitrogen hydrolase [Bradyrhizobium sp.]|uniref:nitrilase-related carbon-nitrogen hydrolase n=1 Tax=Bradyrhizobium sp. TaxID=376 RepID=UPI002D7EB8B9|nr:nitrilase-related carbon-nitrogen hydrolase [Bradyrhizobium sp.]HET7888177.1 nitrilase-related carbon-nitrogen hydrolase [Bradyrhizobium sp.]